MGYPPARRSTDVRFKVLPALAVFILILFTAGKCHSARLDIPFEFSTIETTHFEIHFHQDLDEAAGKAAVYAEEAYSALSNDFRVPSGKTHIVLVDNSDTFSASSAVIPYNAIVIQTAPAKSVSPVYSYGNWLRSAITREFARVALGDLDEGYSKTVRYIFGKPIPSVDPLSLAVSITAGPPGYFLPDWLIEGVSRWEETRITGSVRETFSEMVLRSAVLQDKIPSLSMLNGEHPVWPGSYVPYIFGRELVSHIANTYGADAIGKLAMKHSGRFPFFLNGAPEVIIGKDYPELYSEMIVKLKENEGRAIYKIKKDGITPVKEMDIKGEILSNPRFSPDGSLIAVNRRDPDGHDSILIIKDRKVLDSIRVYRANGPVSWATDGKTFYFCQEEVNSGFYIYKDLYEYNLSDKKIKRLTFGLRTNEADISPDGKSFAVIVNNRGGQNLAILGAAKNSNGALTEKIERVTDYRLTRVEGPRWSPDGSLIAYTVFKSDGTGGLYIYSPYERKHTKLYEGGFSVSSPSWSKNGGLIVFVSDSSGVYNLYAYDMRSRTVAKVTNLLGGAFEPDISKDGAIVFSNYGAAGFKLAAMELPAGSKPQYEKTAANGSDIKEPKEEEDNNIIVTQRPFSPVSTLVPRFWLPAFSRDRDGTVIGAYTAASDVLEYNAYQAEIDYGPASSRFYYDVKYVNDYWYPTFMIEARSRPVLYSDFMKRGTYFELQRSYSIGASVPLNAAESNYAFTAGYTWLRQSALSDLTAGKFEGIDVFEGRRSYVSLGVQFSNRLKYPFSITPEEGRTISVQYRAYSKAFGSMVDSNEYTASYAEYIPLFPESLRHNVLYFNLKGGASAGGRISQQAFQLGGDPSQTYFTLRGFRPRFETGKYAGTATLEYRTPLSYLYGGWGTKPLFMEKFHGALFVDTGEAWGDGASFRRDRLKTGVGFEARLDLNAGYRFKVTPALGVAKGLGPEGTTAVYLYIYSFLDQ